MSYTVKHLYTGARFERPSVLLVNQSRWQQTSYPEVETFHRSLPDYAETNLHSLHEIASELGFSHVFVKDESTRFGLPSFKILGASWAIHRAICQRFDLPHDKPFSALAQTLRDGPKVTLVTCTEGNWGRACARMAKHLGIPIKIFVPGFMNEYLRNLIRGEGAELSVMEDRSYDDCISAVQNEARHSSMLMVMDTSWAGYTEIPRWVTEGYSTMLRETDRQVAAATNGKSASLAVASVGVGSWAHAVVAHYKSHSSDNQIVTVEPVTAASFKESLHCNALVPIETGDTIMNGMNCGTISTIAWEVLREGVSAAVTVSDIEAHESVVYLKDRGINAGPCGAATLAALRTYCAEVPLAVRKDKVVVLFSTEGMREYETPEEAE